MFTLCFGFTIWIPQIGFFLESLKSIKFLKWYLLAAVLLLFIIKFNTLVHPYLLADNRHYIFYIWNRFYGKYDWAKYAVIPVYIAGLSMILKSIEHNTVGFKILFVVSLLFSLCLQRLIELRYFLIPYLILRLNVKHRSVRNVMLELVINLTVNVLTFYLFFTKEIFWHNYLEPQRIIWWIKNVLFSIRNKI